MFQSYWLPALLGGLLLTWAGCCEPEIAGNVANSLRPQETNNWCWAAVTQMLAEHEGIDVSQCDLANHRLGRTDCCDPQSDRDACRKTDSCNRPGWLELTHVGVSFSESTAALAWDALQRQLYCRRDPIGYAYGTPGVVGHVVVVKGYVEVAGTRYVILNDPWAPCAGEERLITYEQYEDPTGTATHWRTWYNLSATPTP